MKATGKKLQIFGIALILIVVLGLLVQYQQFNTILKESKEKNIVGYNQELRDKVNDELENSKDNLKLLSTPIDTVQWKKEDAKEYFEKIVKNSDLMKSIYFGLSTGEVIISDDWQPEEDYDFRKKDWYIDALKEEEVVISSVYEDAQDKIPIVTLSKAIYNQENDLLGVVAADIKVEDVTDVVGKHKNNILDYFFIIDGQGNVLAHKDHQCEECFNLKVLEDLGQNKYKEFQKNKTGKELIKLNNVSGYIFYDVIENTNWTLVSFVSKNNYSNSQDALSTMFFIALILAFVIFLAFTYIFKRYFINPILSFYNDAKRIDVANNLGYRLPSYKHGPFHEIRILANGIIDSIELLILEREKNTREILSQKEDLEISYRQLSRMERELRYQNEKLRKSEKNLEKSLEKNKAMIQALPDALFVLDKKGEILDIQGSSNEDFSISRDKYIGKNIGDIFSQGSLKKIKNEMKNIFKSNRVEKFEYELQGQKGPMKYEIRVTKMNDNEVLGTARNITKRKILEDKLTSLSYKDQLTNLYNRRYFEKKLIEIDKAENLPISIIMADINGLKLINDSLGHNVGDELIKSVGNVLTKGCRLEDTVFRISGDEFIILLSNTSEEIGHRVISRIKNISKKNKVDNKELKDLELAVSFGLGTKNHMDQDINHIVVKAEENMYHSKLSEGQAMRLKTIDSMMESLYRKNAIVRTHTDMAMKYGEKLAKALNLSKDMEETIGKAIYYQEIGKIKISEDFFNKEGIYTEEELVEMKKHPAIGYRILSTVNDMLDISNYVLYHHENYDGTGYPKGLRGNEIPFISRIMRIVNFYVSYLMTKDDGGLGSEEVIIDKLKRNSGKKLDPKLVDIFIEKIIIANKK